MGTKVWKKFQRIEKIGLIGLCGVMLLTLGIGGSTVFGSCSGEVQAGSVTINGEEVEIDATSYNQFIRRHFTLANLQTRIEAMSRRSDAGAPPKITEEQVQRKFLVHQLAKASGMEVSDEALREFIESLPLLRDQKTGRFSKAQYDRLLSWSQFKTPKEFEDATRENLEIGQYEMTFLSAVGPTRQEIYNLYKIQNQKYEVEYTWKPLSDFEKTLEEQDFTDEELKKYYEEIQVGYMVPLKRKVESAYVVLHDVSDEEYQALRLKYADAVDLQVSLMDAWMYWRRRKDDFDENALAAITKALEGKADGADGKNPGGDEDVEPETPDDPGKTNEPDDGDGQTDDDPPAGEAPAPGPDTTGEAGEVNEAGEVVEPAPVKPEGEVSSEPVVPAKPVQSERDTFNTYWAEIVQKELFYQRLASRVLKDARVEGASLIEVAAKYGFRYVSTKLLTQMEMQNVPSIGCEDLRFEMNKYKKSREGSFLPRVLPTTKSSTQPLRRGWQITRLVEVVDAHPAPFKEKKDEVLERYREKRLHEIAIEDVNALAKEIGEDGTKFRTVVEEKGLPHRKLDSFNGKSPVPMPSSDDLESEDAEVKARADEQARDSFATTVAFRNLKGIGKPLSFPMVDVRTKSVLLLHEIGKTDPAPEEMSSWDFDSIRRKKQTDAVTTFRKSGSLSLDVLRKRLEFVEPKLGGR
jgi:SurA-like protein